MIGDTWYMLHVAPVSVDRSMTCSTQWHSHTCFVEGLELEVDRLHNSHHGVLYRQIHIHILQFFGMKRISLSKSNSIDSNATL